MNPNQLKQLEKLSKVFNTSNIISPEDIQEVLKGIALLLADYRKGTVELTEDVKKTFEDVINTISDEHDKVLKEVKNTSETAKSEATETITKAISEMKRMCAEVMEMKPKDGEKGEDADEEKIIEEVLAKIKLPEYKEVVLDDGAEIIAKINDEKVAKINASQIEGLPTFEGKPNGGGWRNLNQLHDVNLSNLANNDVLKYNSTTELWENGVGGGGSGTVTSVAATVPTGLTISGSPVTTSGTLAIALDTGYVIPLQTTLDGFVPYTGATTNVDLGAHNLTVDTNTFFVDSTNNRVGIGTSTPASKLTIYQSAYTAAEGITFDSIGGNATNNGLYRVAATQMALRAGGNDVFFDAGDIRTSSGPRIRGAAGASTTPTYAWNGDPDTGMYNPSADALGFSTAGLERLRIDSSGLVGIGTTTPDQLLHEEVSDAGTNAVVFGQRHSHITSGTATTGFGIGEEYELENASGTNRVAGTNEFAWTDATNATEDASWKLKLMRAGTLTEALGVDSLGTMTVATNIELGHASDTTLSRVSAGVVAIEGNNIVTANLNASSAEINTGTSTTKFNTPDALAGSYAGTKSVSIAVFAPTTDVATGDGKAYITIPEALNGMDLIRAQATVVTAGTTNATTVMIHNVTDAVDMLSGAISIASGGTVGTVGTINTSNDGVATNDILRVDVDSVSTTAPKGLMVILEFRLP